jgi:hypothetical protein
MYMATLLGSQQARECQAEGAERPDLQQTTARQAITKTAAGIGWAENVQHWTDPWLWRGVGGRMVFVFGDSASRVGVQNEVENAVRNRVHVYLRVFIGCLTL